MIVTNEPEKKIDYADIGDRYERRNKEVAAIYEKRKGQDLLNVFQEEQQPKMAIILGNQTSANLDDMVH